jgi:transcription termination factor Rho
MTKAPAKSAEKRTESVAAPAAAAVAAPAASVPAAAETAEAPAEGTRARGRGRSRRAVSDGVVAPAAAEAAAEAPAAPAEAPAAAEAPEATEGAERRQPRTRNRRRGEAAAAAPQAAEAVEAPAEQAEAEQRIAEPRTETEEAGQRTDRREAGRGRGRDTRESGDSSRDNAGSREAGQREGARRDDNRDTDDADGGSRRNRRNRRDRNDRNDRNDRSGGQDRDNSSRNDRFRDRNDRRRGRAQGPDVDDVEVTEDDVLLPVAGILDVLENYAFIRTSGYLPGPNDVYVSLAQVKKYNLRKGDAVVGAIRAPRDGEDRSQQSTRQKFNALVRVTSVNGKTSEELKDRVEFAKLVPLYPSERLRLETDPKKIGPRVIDLVAPIGKGQRGLIVSPPKAGKTLILQSIANAITTNNPEVHLMMVLVDERP